MSGVDPIKMLSVNVIDAVNSLRVAPGTPMTPQLPVLADVLQGAHPR